METTSRHDPNPRPSGPELDLYTIPRQSSWFRWDDIHATERSALKEFFDGSSITRSPKIYKEYRDFMINKYREDPSRRLNFTDVRKSLVGDVSLLLKVFRFLDTWGLINFGAANTTPFEEEEERVVRVEDGAPVGIRVVATASSLKPISVPQKAAAAANSERVARGQRLPPLASYSDVFRVSEKEKKFVCGNCNESCDSNRYEYVKGNYVICGKCFENGSFGENKSKDDFKLNDSVDNSCGKQAVWTEDETLLLLESVLRHGDDWDLVVQSVKTKTKLECISKITELPFGDVILGSVHGRGNSSGLSGSMNSAKRDSLSLSKQQETIQNEDVLQEETNANEQNGETVDEGPSLKRKRITSPADAGSSLMKQLALISTMVDSDITAAAAEAAVVALCDETSCPREIFDDVEAFLVNGLQSSTVDSNADRPHQNENVEMKDRPTNSENQDMYPAENDVPITLRLRAAIATAFGAAASRAKLLADQEDQEIENLVATIIETQSKKLHHKLKHFDELELIMEKEYTELEELKQSLTEERIDVLQKTINDSTSKWRDRDFVKPQTGSVC